MRKALLTAVATVALAAQANAAGFTNGSFEVATNFVPNGDNTMSLGVGSTAMTGWTVIGGSISWIGTPDPFAAQADPNPGGGNYFLDLTDYRDATPYGGVQQTFDVFQGHNYTVTFDLGSSSAYGAPDALQASVAGFSQVFTSTSTPAASTWETKSFNFDTGNDASVTLAFLGTRAGNYIGLDNIRVVDNGRSAAAAVPEPASWAMMVGGFGLIGGALRRRTRNALHTA